MYRAMSSRPFEIPSLSFGSDNLNNRSVSVSELSGYRSNVRSSLRPIFRYRLGATDLSLD